jgi:putative NIF3 family GTP cyclohydrolase 1 type 2
VIDATHYGLEHIFISYIREYLEEKLKGTDTVILEVDMGCPAQIL